ncbi:MAG TPA: enoyl-CoA hydratase-related protein [Nevskia sp.]|nr:enoyl-CoA hydratase-related protein [Nevskia sp.]
MNLPETQNLLLRLDGGVLHLTLNRPEQRNAMNRGMVEEISAVFDAVREARGVRAIVVRGAGGCFCAGGDLKEMLAGGLKAPQAGEADPVVEFSRAFGAMLRKVNQAPQVVVAVLEGAALAGGFGLACVSDVALAHADTKFGVPETTRGLPPAQIAPFIVERIGLTQARKLCLTGAQFKGVEALRLGFVHEVHADTTALDAALEATLKQILGCAPLANAMTKEIVLNPHDLDMDAVLDDAAHKFAAAVRGAEAPEGITAFMQKRAPKWAT